MLTCPCPAQSSRRPFLSYAWKTMDTPHDILLVFDNNAGCPPFFARRLNIAARWTCGCYVCVGCRRIGTWTAVRCGIRRCVRDVVGSRCTFRGMYAIKPFSLSFMWSCSRRKVRGSVVWTKRRAQGRRWCGTSTRLIRGCNVWGIIKGVIGLVVRGRHDSERTVCEVVRRAFVSKWWEYLSFFITMG